MASSLPHAVTLGRHREIALKVAGAISSQATVAAIYGEDLDATKFNTLLKALNPRPQVLLIGGGFSDEDADEATTLFKTFRSDIEAQEEAEQGKISHVVRIDVGTLEGKGPPAIIQAIKGELTRVFG